MHSSRRQPQTQPVHSFSVSDQGCSPICRHCKQQCSAMAPGHGGTLGSILQNWQASRRAGAGRLRYSFRTCSYRRIWLYAVKCAGLVIEEPDAVAGFLHSSGWWPIPSTLLYSRATKIFVEDCCSRTSGCDRGSGHSPTLPQLLQHDAFWSDHSRSRVAPTARPSVNSSGNPEKGKWLPAFARTSG
jgi:hypothetical protein